MLRILSKFYHNLRKSFQVEGLQIGPSLVHLHLTSSWMGRGVLIQYILPLEPMVQRVVHLFYTEPSWWSLYAKVVLWGESILLERDIVVWNSKTYADKPLTGGNSQDVLLVKYRRWYQQFYTAKSQSADSEEDNPPKTIDW